jgi:Trk K+ transport system NAD-binding subunit
MPAETRTSWTDASATLHIVEQPLPAAWAGRPLADLEVPGRIKVVGVNRAGSVRLDATEMVGQERDSIIFALGTDGHEALAARLGEGA